MEYWLKFVGEIDQPLDPNTLHDEPFVAFTEAAGFPRMHEGDLIILYATGHRRIFAVAKATSDGYDHAQLHPDRWGRYSGDITYICNSNRPPTEGFHGDEFNPPFRGYGGGRRRIARALYHEAAERLCRNSRRSCVHGDD